jgi:hypothetical protein
MRPDYEAAGSRSTWNLVETFRGVRRSPRESGEFNQTLYRRTLLTT